ncbi:MAG: gamma carbonic anhydrase family protein [Clostridia bacterium]|nr:gamma carbonic anhydrase family protein [Clostridia bacterium]
MAIYEFEGKRPEIHATTFVHPEATIIGDVIIGTNCYIGPGARIRGDWGTIKIGDGSNVQENCVIHAAPDKEAVLGINSHIGHGAILHGPILEEHVVVGINAIILDDAVIGAGSCLGAGTVVVANTVIPPKSLVMGVPGKVTAEVSDKLSERLKWGTGVYQTLPKRCYDTLKEIPGK